MSIVASVPAVGPVCWSPCPGPELESAAVSAGFAAGPPGGAVSAGSFSSSRSRIASASDSGSAVSSSFY